MKNLQLIPDIHQHKSIVKVSFAYDRELIALLKLQNGAFLACNKSANPAACTIAIAAHNCGQDPACDGVVKKFIEDGCNYTVEVVGDKLKVYGKASKEKLFEMQKTYEALNSVQGIYSVYF